MSVKGNYLVVKISLNDAKNWIGDYIRMNWITMNKNKAKIADVLFFQEGYQSHAFLHLLVERVVLSKEN